MNIKNIDLSSRTVWGINHKIRNSNPFTLFDVQAMVIYFEQRDGIKYQIKNIINQTNGLINWQIKEL